MEHSLTFKIKSVLQILGIFNFSHFRHFFFQALFFSNINYFLRKLTKIDIANARRKKTRVTVSTSSAFKSKPVSLSVIYLIYEFGRL